MKIVYLSSPISSQYGGGEKLLDDFTSGIEAEHEFIGSSRAVHSLFQSKGYKTTLTSGLFEPVSPRNLLLIPISIVVGLFQFIRFYKTFQTADWIISPTSHCETFFVIPWIKLLLGKPVLFMIHAKPPKIFGIFPFNQLVSKCWGNSPVTFVSNSQKELWTNAGCVSSNQIVIYNGVKINKLNLETSGKINCPYQGAGSEADWASLDTNGKVKVIKIGFLARLHKEKGCDVLINALELIKSTEQIEIIIAGDGPERQNLTDLYQAKKLPSNIKVEFIGFQADTKSFYDSIDLLVFPSKSEGFSLVLLESWERGLPVLTSNIKPFLEAKSFQAVEEQQLIFKLNDSLDLAQKLDFIIQHKEIYLTYNYKQKLHDSIKKNFSKQQMIKGYQDLILSDFGD